MKKLLLVSLISAFSYSAFSQSVISCGGASATNSGYMLSWTIGEPVVATFTQSSNTLTQGFHQSNLIVTSISTFGEKALSIQVYPNPVSDLLYIKSEITDNTLLKYKLSTSDGKTILCETMDNPLKQIDLQNFASGLYILTVEDNTGKNIQGFRVVKK